MPLKQLMYEEKQTTKGVPFKFLILALLSLSVLLTNSFLKKALLFIACDLINTQALLD